jgi:tripartite-type tricarboxylate transporter receptor subunit TctC
MKMKNRTCLRLLAAGLMTVSSLLPTLPAYAQTWSQDKPVRLIVPWAPGGAVDSTARAIATAMSIRLKHPFVVENKPGASGMIGAAYAASTAPDGYTFVMGNVDTQVMDPLLFPRTIRYDAEKSFDALMQLGRVPMALVQNPRVDARNAQDFVQMAKAKPGTFSYGTWGVGSTAHLAFLLLEQQTGVDLNHLPYPGAPPAYAALLGGHVDFALAQVPWAISAAKEGKVKILGVTNAKRSTLAPSLPTMAEVGFKDYAVEGWVGLYAPKGVPAQTRNYLVKEIGAWLESPEGQTIVQAGGVEPAVGDGEQLLARQKNETAFWSSLIKDKNLNLDK